MLKPDVMIDVRVIWKCRNRDCKHPFAIMYKRYAYDGGKMSEQLFRLPNLDYDRPRWDDAIWLAQDEDTLRCPKCSCRMPRANVVHGVYNAQKKCSARCMGATGGTCECECGGTNHGCSH